VIQEIIIDSRPCKNPPVAIKKTNDGVNLLSWYYET